MIRPTLHPMTTPLLAQAKLPAHQVLVTVGTGCSMSAVGSTETHRALVTKDTTHIGFAAFDAQLVDIKGTPENPKFYYTERGNAQRKGEQVSLDEIEFRWGKRLRQESGIRFLDREMMAAHLQTDIAGPLPYDLEQSGLRELSGLSFAEIRQSPLKDMFGLFDDDRRLGPSLQTQLFMYGGLGALAALPAPLSTLIPEAHRFRVGAACCFQGHDAWEALNQGMQRGAAKVDKVAYRLASVLSTHGPAMITTMLSPAFSLSKVRRHPELLEQLRPNQNSVLRNVPQAPIVSSAACASAYLTFCDLAPHLLLSSFPGYHAPEMVLWTAADAAVQPDARILEGFGPGAMMNREKLAAMESGRSVSESLAPFDVDAKGTIVGNAGSGLVVTTLDYVLQQAARGRFLDITGLIVGWAQSGETGGKGHMAGVGFGGENALIRSLMMASEGHGYGITDFGHVVSHGTGTRTNSKTDLGMIHSARQAVAEAQGFAGQLAQMTVGAPKAVGDAHTMGETGLKSTREKLYYLLGQTTVGIPSLRTLDPDLGDVAANFILSADPVRGNEEGGAISAVQGFGGYNGALAMRSANPDTISRYAVSNRQHLEAYLEAWSEARQQREEREANWRRTRGFIRRMAEEHRWPGMKV